MVLSKKTENQNQAHRDSQKNTCGATAKSTGEPCKLPAGFGTDHVGVGRCKYHGGLSTGAPKRNKNAVKTHEHETIWLDTLDEEEKEKYENIKTDVLDQLDNEIRLTDIRIRRMMMRIRDIKEEEMITIEQTFKRGNSAKGPIDITESKNQAVIEQINNIEEALTRVQHRKEKLLRLKHDIEDGTGDEEEKLQAVVEAMNKAAGA